MNDLDVEKVKKGADLDVEVVGGKDELKQGLLLHLDSSFNSALVIFIFWTEHKKHDTPQNVWMSFNLEEVGVRCRNVVGLLLSRVVLLPSSRSGVVLQKLS